MEDTKPWISSSWLPDEVINIDECPHEVVLPRRYTFRFLRIEVIDIVPLDKMARLRSLVPVLEHHQPEP